MFAFTDHTGRQPDTVKLIPSSLQTVSRVAVQGLLTPLLHLERRNVDERHGDGPVDVPAKELDLLSTRLADHAGF